MNRSDPKQSVRELLEEAHPALIGLSHWIHANPEVGFEEHHASDWVNEWLQTAGFEVERGVADMPTALIGRFGPGPFHVAICVEYDALPEVGHACGHNVIAAAGVGAGLALASVADELGLRVSVMGTPAEESGGGKLRFIEAGYFGDVHAAAMVHPWPSDVATPDIIAITQLDVTYRGHEAHAAGFPHRGRNAADALVIAQTAIGLLRQQLLPTDRVHGIVTKGGDAPNIIPALTQAFFMVRAEDRERLEELTGLVRRCFEAGALATGTEVEVVEGTRYANMIHDADLAALYRQNGEQLGRVFDDTPGAPVSTDMGDVSHVVPSIHPMIAIDSAGAVNHQREFAEACATPSADQAILDGALGLAWTVIDAAQNQVIRARLMGEADIREGVALVEEVEELDAHADVLDELAVSIAAADPELAERIAAAADALETRADELADEADDHFEHAQDLADEALIDEVTGELESDVEDMVVLADATATDAPLAVELVSEAELVEALLEDAPSTGTDRVDVVDVVDVVEVVAVSDVTGADDVTDGPLGAWEPAEAPAEVVIEAVAEADALADIWGSEEPTVELAVETELASPSLESDAGSVWETATAMAEPAQQVPDAVEDQPVSPVLADAHGAWERDFLLIAEHAAWEEQFAGALATTTEPVEAVAEAQPEPEPEAVEVVAEAQPDPEPETVEVVAEAQPDPEPETVEAEAQPDPEPETVEAVAEPQSFVTGDDIWYSGAPDDELPSAELLSEEPVAVAATTERVDEFVWIPGDEDR